MAIRTLRSLKIEHTHVAPRNSQSRDSLNAILFAMPSAALPLTVAGSEPAIKLSIFQLLIHAIIVFQYFSFSKEAKDATYFSDTPIKPYSQEVYAYIGIWYLMNAFFLMISGNLVQASLALAAHFAALLAALWVNHIRQGKFCTMRSMHSNN